MELRLTEQQREFATRFEQLCRECIAPRAAAVDRSGELPAANLADLAQAGYFGLFHPREIGGTGVDGVSLGLAMEALARACGSTFWTATISTLLCGKILHGLGTPLHHRRWLVPIVHGEKLGAFGLIERGSGCDPASCQTALRRTPHGFLLSGEKCRISNGPAADVCVVVANLEREARGPVLPAGNTRYVVVDMAKRGIAVSSLGKLGLRGMPWGVIKFDEVEIDEADVIDPKDPLVTDRAIEWGQLLQSFGALGFASAAFEASLDYAARRTSFGRPLAHMPVVHTRIADMRVQIDAARLLAQQAIWRKGRGEPAREWVLMSKVYATEMAVRVAEDAMHIHGGWGYSTEFPIERLLRDSLANVPAGLPTDRLRELLACPWVGADSSSYPAFDWLSGWGLRIGDGE
jgi:alkylation response protein AidB-like acyl-CoA dehydrogenase